jgi:hypothetical protein
MRLDVGFRRFVVYVGAVETHAPGISGVVNVGTQHIPALTQMQHSAVPLYRPTLGGDSKPLI